MVLHYKKSTKVYYLHAEEEEPLRSAKVKTFITKIMFLTAVARPRLGFDGKIGIWPFVVKGAAKTAKLGQWKPRP